MKTSALIIRALKHYEALEKKAVDSPKYKGLGWYEIGRIIASLAPSQADGTRSKREINAALYRLRIDKVVLFKLEYGEPYIKNGVIKYHRPTIFHRLNVFDIRYEVREGLYKNRRHYFVFDKKRNKDVRNFRTVYRKDAQDKADVLNDAGYWIAPVKIGDTVLN